MDADVGSNVITLDSGGSARVPSAREVQIIGALSSNVLFTDVFL